MISRIIQEEHYYIAHFQKTILLQYLRTNSCTVPFNWHQSKIIITFWQHLFQNLFKNWREVPHLQLHRKRLKLHHINIKIDSNLSWKFPPMLPPDRQLHHHPNLKQVHNIFVHLKHMHSIIMLLLKYMIDFSFINLI